MYYVYIIESIDFDQIYVGITQDVDRRLKEHNSGKSYHTEKFRPWRLKTFIAFHEKEKAFVFEKYLKSGSGRAFTKKHLLGH